MALQPTKQQTSPPQLMRKQLVRNSRGTRLRTSSLLSSSHTPRDPVGVNATVASEKEKRKTMNGSPPRQLPLVPVCPTIINTTTATAKAAEKPMKKHAMNVYRLISATRTWQRYTLKKANKPSVIVPNVKYENTYRLQPDSTHRFSPFKVETILKEVLESRLAGVRRYSAELCRGYATELASLIRLRVKSCGFHRYKLVCVVLITENKGQGCRVVSRALMDSQTDSFASYTFCNSAVVAVASVHGLYFE